MNDAGHGFFSGALSRRGSVCNFKNSVRGGKHSAPGETIAGLGGGRRLSVGGDGGQDGRPPTPGWGRTVPLAVGGELGLNDAAHGFFSGALSRRGSVCNFKNSARAGKHSAPGEIIAGLGGHWLSGAARGYRWELCIGNYWQRIWPGWRFRWCDLICSGAGSAARMAGTLNGMVNASDDTRLPMGVARRNDRRAVGGGGIGNERDSRGRKILVRGFDI